MTTKEILAELEALGNDKLRLQNIKRGSSENQYGVKLGDIRKLSKRLGTNHELGLALWKTENEEARLLSTLIIVPADLSVEELDNMVKSMTSPQLADWVNANVIKYHHYKDALREKWMESSSPMAARCGWDLTSKRISKHTTDNERSELLDRLESEMPSADPVTQWTMNFALASIGIYSPAHRERAIAIGNNLGIYRDYPVSKGCTSPFAPIWIEEMVRRQG